MKHSFFIFALCLLGMPSLASFSTNPNNQLGVSLPTYNRSTCQLPAPASFDADQIDSGTVLLTWATVSGAASYRLIVYNQDSHELVSNTVQYGAQTQLGGLQEGVNYRCILASMCSLGSTSEFIIYEDILF